ncbi:PIN domain-containing protein [Brevundimonas sp.]|uniref:PIN domain-containing protein n=1 Tax=Brevundimonas sp. TaxID=1871086 RepID=UPI002ABAC6C2|nr:PIN domain-containing protein [Brevundimonas sp.]MDZ4363081.1 PIN domain-containing protein [Brevundimonas sp.]
MRRLFDTNILIDVTRGHAEAIDLVRNSERACISVVTRIELLAGPDRDAARLKAMMRRFEIIGIDDGIAEAAAVIRRDVRLKLPDAVILATAQVRRLLLVTRNTKDFEGRDGVVIPYRL